MVDSPPSAVVRFLLNLALFEQREKHREEASWRDVPRRSCVRWRWPVRLPIPPMPNGRPADPDHRAVNRGRRGRLPSRVLADKLSPMLGATIIVDNRTGGGGLVGVATTSQAAPDGYTAGDFRRGLQPDRTRSVSANPGF